jgi:hypothetical protein
MLALLAEITRSEVETLRERINSGLAEARRKGVGLGWPPGTKIDRNELFRKLGDILRHLRAGQSVRHTAKITGKGVSTVQRVKLAWSTSLAHLRVKTLADLEKAMADRETELAKARAETAEEDARDDGVDYVPENSRAAPSVAA